MGEIQISMNFQGYLSYLKKDITKFWKILKFFKNLWGYSALIKSPPPPVKGRGSFWQEKPISADIFQHLPIFGDVGRYLQISADV